MFVASASLVIAAFKKGHWLCGQQRHQESGKWESQVFTGDLNSEAVNGTNRHKIPALGNMVL